MAYDDTKMVCVALDEFDFGADANEILSFRLPTGYVAKLLKIGVSVTEEFACATTAAAVKLGTAADDDAYALLVIADETADLDFFDETDDTDAIIEDDIAADTLLQVTLVQSTDDSADAGKGRVMMYFQLYHPTKS